MTEFHSDDKVLKVIYTIKDYHFNLDRHIYIYIYIVIKLSMLTVNHGEIRGYLFAK